MSACLQSGHDTGSRVHDETAFAGGGQQRCVIVAVGVGIVPGSTIPALFQCSALLLAVAVMFYEPPTPTARKLRPQNGDISPGGQEPLRKPYRRRRYHEHAITSCKMAIHRSQAVVAPTKAAFALLKALYECLDAFRNGVLIVAQGRYPKQDGGTDSARCWKPDQEQTGGQRNRGSGAAQP